MPTLEDKIKSVVYRKGLKMIDFVDQLGYQRTTYYRKVRMDEGVLTIKDLRKMREILHLTDQELLDLIIF